MSNEMVEVPFEGKAGDKAVLLLEAADSLGVERGSIRTRDGNLFLAPKEVVEKAFGKKAAKAADADKAPAKKAAAKKAPAKKAAAKKAAPSKPASTPAANDKE